MDLLVNIDVPELEPAIDFYCAAFGLTIGRRFGSGGAELLGTSSPIYVLAKEAGTRALPGTAIRRSYERHWTPVHLDFVVNDVPAAVERAVQAGARLEAKPRTAEWGTIARLSDPFGNGFCILAFSEAGYDAIAEPTTGAVVRGQNS